MIYIVLLERTLLLYLALKLKHSCISFGYFYIFIQIKSVMKTSIRNVKKVPIMKLVLGFVLICIGIHGAIFTNVFALVLSGIGVFLVLSEGSEINLVTKKYR